MARTKRQKPEPITEEAIPEVEEVNEFEFVTEEPKTEIEPVIERITEPAKPATLRDIRARQRAHNQML